MSEPKFTPGPWVAFELPNRNMIERSWRVSADRTLNIKVSACPDGFVLGENDANAHLIAAAPDLYAALEKAVADYGKPGGPWNVPSEPGTWLEMAKNAIKKARGEE